jgi:hypothetical protein
MMMTNKAAFGLSLDLGLVISIWSPNLGCELSRGFPRGRASCALVDLMVTPVLVETADGCENTGTALVEALTEDGQAFLDLLSGG